MTNEGERIAKVEVRLEHLNEVMERIEKKLDKSLSRHYETEKRVDAFENKARGIQWFVGVVAAAGAFFGIKVGYWK